MDLPGINSQTNLLLDQASSSAQSERLRQLAQHEAGSQESREGLEKAAKQFEGVFLNTLLKAMRKTVPENELFNSGGPTKFYQQMYDSEVAKALAGQNGGMGIADLIVNQFENTLKSDDARVEESVPPIGAAPADGMIGPPSPVGVPAALSRYQALSPVGEEIARRQMLRLQAGRQGQAVADTLDRFENEIGSAARDSGLDPALILAVVMEESGGDPAARSPKGAEGLMQLMPGTAAELGVEDACRPAENLRGGSRYLAQMLDRYDRDLDLALAAYNAGPGNVDRAGKQVPDFPETRRYVAAVKERYQSLQGGTNLDNDKP
jgi:Rod binding domain-containing protein